MPIAEELYERIIAAKVFIDENYHESIDLDEISRKAFLSRYHFHRLFSQVYKKHRTNISHQNAFKKPKFFFPKTSRLQKFAMRWGLKV